MQTNPEQWARDLMCDLPGEHWDSEGIDTGALTIQAAFAEREARLVGALAMAVAEMSYARGRLETIATGNEDRRIAAKLGSTCDFIRTEIATLKDWTDG